MSHTDKHFGSIKQKGHVSIIGNNYQIIIILLIFSECPIDIGHSLNVL